MTRQRETIFHLLSSTRSPRHSDAKPETRCVSAENRVGRESEEEGEGNEEEEKNKRVIGGPY